MIESFYLATLGDYLPGGDAAAAVAKEIASGSPAAGEPHGERIRMVIASVAAALVL